MKSLRLIAPLLLGVCLLGPSGLVQAADAPLPPLIRMPVPTNRPAMTFGARTNPAVAIRSGTTVTGTNALTSAKPKTVSTNALAADWIGKIKTAPNQPWFYPAIGVLIGAFLILLIVMQVKAKRSSGAPSATGSTAVARPTRRPGGKVHACTVLEVTPEARQVWQFDAGSSKFAIHRQHAARGDAPLPASIVAKDWTTLFQKKLNIAWLPSEKVFLRVIQLPISDFNETLAMIEFQLEKLSPMPVGQIVWSIQVLPYPAGAKSQTVIVLMVARSEVEQYLGALEAQGYLADRLDLPLLDQLTATSVTEDGAWIYPDNSAAYSTAMVAWWYGGVLQNLNLVNLPAENRAESVKEQLLQVAWAGEMEGWLTAPPIWHLVADPSAAAQWEPALREGLEQPVAVVAPLARPQLAALTARRAAADENQANLLPVEFSTRYQQQFVDRLWMRGLGTLLAIYIVGVMIYFVALYFASYRTGNVESQVAALGQSFTNALQLEARYQVLKDRQDLKFAALDCWNAAASLMPESLTLDSLNFNDGKRVTLTGSAPTDKVTQLLEFESAMRKHRINDQPLFDPNKGDNLSYHANPANSTVSWNFGLELKRVEVQ